MNAQTPIPTVNADGVTEVGGARYMMDGAGRLVPLATVKAQHALEDQTVRKIVAFAIDLSAQIARFRGHTFDDVTSFVELLAERYGDSRGGAKGNITLTSYDNCLKVVVQAQDQITFGAELQVAKTLVDACITEWAEGAAPNLRALVEHAFQVDKEGRINRSALFALRRLDIVDAQWKAAMQAIADAVRVVGSKEYVRFYRRKDHRARWEPITIDLAAA
ncbi:DUF3164 family protein [Xanthobacteraceae bacterium Astr-EGSB]|uniref:DUF3164 family protein n=1 Tax=Astrobacterium formosum TaxID=3069710 RepID=UPI0027AFF8EA|nr:DUF3164 family protein [Xanthobacteraceae bacterium Astr-EGSB]